MLWSAEDDTKLTLLQMYRIIDNDSDLYYEIYLSVFEFNCPNHEMWEGHILEGKKEWVLNILAYPASEKPAPFRTEIIEYCWRAPSAPAILPPPPPEWNSWGQRSSSQ